MSIKFFSNFFNVKPDSKLYTDTQDTNLDRIQDLSNSGSHKYRLGIRDPRYWIRKKTIQDCDLVLQLLLTVPNQKVPGVLILATLLAAYFFSFEKVSRKPS
jgi:hypothetical protein